MNPLWTAPALQWKPFSGAAVVLLLYGVTGALAGTQDHPKMEVMIPLFVSLFIPLPKHVFSRFAGPDVTEWLLGMGLDRRRLALRYALDLLWWSLVHGCGGVLLVKMAPRFDLFRQQGWTPGVEIVQLFVAIFLIQLTVRSAIGIAAHLDCSTLVPARMKDEFSGVRTSFWTTVGYALVALPGMAVVIGGPVALVATTGSFHWLAVPAAIYFRLAHAMAGTSEFVRKIAAPVDDWGLTLAPPAIPPPPREFFAELRSDRAASAPLRGLLWDGLGRGMKALLFSLFLLLGAAGAWWLASTPDDRRVQAAFFWVFAAVIPVFFGIAGKRVFAWNRSEDATEYLFVRGVTLRTLDRIRMIWALGVSVLLFGGMALFQRWLSEEKAPYFPLWAVACYVGSALLLECNRRPLRWPILGCSTFEDLGKVLTGGWWVIFMVGGAVLGRVLGAESPGWLVIGLALIVPAFLGWVGTIVPLLLRR